MTACTSSTCDREAVMRIGWHCDNHGGFPRSYCQPCYSNWLILYDQRAGCSRCRDEGVSVLLTVLEIVSLVKSDPGLDYADMLRSL